MIIASRIATYSRQLSRWTAMAMCRSCTNSMHLPVRPNDPDSISAGRLRDAVLLEDDEITYSWSNSHREESERPPFGHASTNIFAPAAISGRWFLRPTEETFQLEYDFEEGTSAVEDPYQEESETEQPQFDDANTTTIALSANNESQFCRLTDETFRVETGYPKVDIPETWTRNGFTFLRLN